MFNTEDMNHMICFIFLLLFFKIYILFDKNREINLYYRIVL